MPYKIEAMANKPYRPSNGTEGMMFCEQFCDRCRLQAGEGYGCDIFMRTMAHDLGDEEYPSEWVHDFAGRPQCTAFVEQT